MTTETLEFVRVLNAPAALVYRAFTNSSTLREWFCDAALADPRPDGRLYFWWNSGYYASGEFTAVTKETHIAFTWYGRNEPAPTQVAIALAAEGDGTRITLTHSGLGAGEAWIETSNQFQRGWELGLENLASLLETGQDQRFVRRPMLGVTVGEFDSDLAARLGVPVTKGIRLDGVIDGMGAKAAGLQQDDVIVGIGGSDVVDWASLTAALQDRQADDEVEVAFYRGAERQSTTMVLSRRPLPELPATAQDLSDAVCHLYDELDAELEELFQGVSEEAALFRPAPEAWSAKETLAHLIASERWLHGWVTDMIGGNEPWYDDWGGNVPARHAAVLAVYPTVVALLEELKRCELETVALLAALPPEFVARKGSYTRLGYHMLESPGMHPRQHLEQIRDALKAAKR